MYQFVHKYKFYSCNIHNIVTTFVMHLRLKKVKWQIYWTELEENSKRKSLIKWQNQKLRHIKRMNNNCHIPELVQAFSCVENCGLNLVLKLAKPVTSMIVSSNSITSTTMCEQKHNALCYLITFDNIVFVQAVHVNSWGRTIGVEIVILHSSYCTITLYYLLYTS